jgi:hypothetical protein
MPGVRHHDLRRRNTCPHCGTILNRTCVTAVGLVMKVAIAVLYVLSQRYW